MHAWPDDLRLIVTLAANALLLVASWRVARRSNARAVVALPDALLFWLAAQYVIVGVCGVVGLLWPTVMLGVAGLASIAVLVRLSPTIRSTNVGENRVTWIAFAFVVAYSGAFLIDQRVLPALATDALVYHLPAAARWVQDGRISLVDFWYWLPANTYSPLAGSTWIAWWLAPLGNDVLARFVQWPAWLLLFAASLRLLRDLRVASTLAAISATALVVSRPFTSQLVITKDDIAVAALAIVLLGGLHPRRLRERVAPYRLGIAFGLLISVKYPSLLALPTLAPAILAFRWRSLGVRGIALGGTIALAFVSPWLIRNAIVAGNPVYPFFAGGASFVADPSLRSIRGLYAMLAGSFHSLPPAMWLIVFAAFPLAIARGRTWRDPIALSLVVGPPLAIAVLVIGCPFAEVRYLFTAIAALLAMVGVAIARVPKRGARVPIAAGVLLVSLATSFVPDWLPRVAAYAGVGVAGAGVVGLVSLLARGVQLRLIGIATLVALGAIYVEWPGIVRHPDAGYERTTADSFVAKYGDAGVAWNALRANAPDGSTIAVVNTPTTWPLYGFDIQFHVVYAPVRSGVAHWHDLPPIRTRVPARDEYLVHTRLMNEGADVATWLANLDRLRVDFVYLAKHDASDAPPEARFIADHAGMFERVSDNAAASVWRIRRP